MKALPGTRREVAASAEANLDKLTRGLKLSSGDDDNENNPLRLTQGDQELEASAQGCDCCRKASTHSKANVLYARIDQLLAAPR